MRVIAGSLRGRKLAAPRGRELRPSADRTRETLFNILAHGPFASLENARVADLFAGTGALGIEALSRGAKHAVFVETSASSRALLEANLAALSLGTRARVLALDATRLPPAAEACDLVFLDPPYRKGLVKAALASLLAGGWLAPGASVIVETAADELPDFGDGFELVSARRCGAAHLRFLAPAASRACASATSPAAR